MNDSERPAPDVGVVKNDEGAGDERPGEERPDEERAGETGVGASHPLAPSAPVRPFRYSHYLLLAGVILGILSALIDRALAPAMSGVWTGAGTAISFVESTAHIASQLFAILGVALAVGAVVAVSRAPLHAAFRVFSVGVVGLVSMAVASAIFIRLPEASTAIAALGASLLGLIAALRRNRFPVSRAASLILGAAACAGLFHVATVGLGHAYLEGVDRWQGVSLASTVVVLKSISVFFQGIAVALAVGWAAWRSQLWLSITLLVGLLTVAGLLVYVAAGGAALEAGGLTVLLNRAFDRLLTEPAPYIIPAVGRAFVEVLAWLVAATVLLKRWPLRFLPACVALIMVARGALDAPLCALSLVIAALWIALSTTGGGYGVSWGSALPSERR